MKKISPSQTNPYFVLNVSQSVSKVDLKNQYIKLTKKYHPDIDPSNSEKFREIQEAYKMLVDFTERSKIDDILHKDNCKTSYQDISKIHNYVF